MNSSKKYFLTRSISINDIKNRITGKYTLHKTTREKGSYVFYDTFDWRLYQKKYLLYKDVDHLYFQKKTAVQPSKKLDIKSIPAFVHEFPEGDLKKVLTKIVEMRALLIQAEINYLKNNYDVLDSNKKIVIRLSIESYPRIGKFLTLSALRGYSSHLVKFLNMLNTEFSESSTDDLYHKILQINKKTPADYNPRISIILKPEMPSNTAAKVIHKNLLHTLNQNLNGVIKDIDTEFLHDFRVASRRTRAALTQIKDVFDQESTDKFNSGFREIGKQTNKMRDLDVYLIHKHEYINRLPKNMQIHIDPFFEQLQKDRTLEHKKLNRYLKSQKYLKLVTDWNRFLSSTADKYVGSNGKIPIIELAITFIKTQYIKVLKLGNKISDNSQDSMLHKLRIQCKKLRYLLEFFGSLFPQDEINILIGNLKKLQDNLGKFNDLSVQQKFLKHFVVNKTFSTDTVLAIGYLVGKLNDEQNVVRENFKKSFGNFDSVDTKKIFDQLFNRDTGRN